MWLRQPRDSAALTVVREHRAAARVPASRVPSIAGVRLSPPGVDATLVNISAHGVAVECGRRVEPRSEVTVFFDGSFDPSSVEGHVARCGVAGIGPDGELQYELGIAFNTAIELAEAPTPAAGRPTEIKPAAAPPATDVRNRW